MKRILKKLVAFIIFIFILFSIYIIEENVRLEAIDTAVPLIVLDKTKLCVSCIKSGEELEVEYYSLGYKAIIRYYRPDKSSPDNKIIKVVGKEFLLFNKYRLWAWIS